MQTILRSKTGVEVPISSDLPFVIIGERINAPGRKALAADDHEWQIQAQWLLDAGLRRTGMRAYS